MIAHRNKYSLGKSIPVKITTVVENVRTTDDGSRYLCIVVHDIEMSIRHSQRLPETVHVHGSGWMIGLRLPVGVD